MSLANKRKFNFLLFGALLFLLFIAAACGPSQSSSSGGNTSASTPTVSNATPTSAAGSGQGQSTGSASTPVVVTPNSSSGAAGTGPVVINTPTPVSGGSTTSQQVTLPDRQLLINNVSKQDNSGSTMITLAVTVKNTSGNAIKNQADFFQLMGAEGDAFSQSNSSDNFYGAIQPHGMRSGTIIFRVPTAAATKLRLLYRSEIASETVITDLNV